jgi:uncharacterized protein with HEPN domain
MRNRSYTLFVKDILVSIDKIGRFLHGMSFEQFVKDEMLIDGVVRNLEIIGEASRTIPESLKKQLPDIPWKSMIAFRNLAIHEYFQLDLSITWKIITKDLPETRPKIEAMLKAMDEKEKR